MFFKVYQLHASHQCHFFLTSDTLALWGVHMCAWVRVKETTFASHGI